MTSRRKDLTPAVHVHGAGPCGRQCHHRLPPGGSGESLLEDHKSEARRQAETRVKAETTNATLSLNQAAAKSQLEIKRRQGKVQQELKDKIFEEAEALSMTI